MEVNEPEKDKASRLSWRKLVVRFSLRSLLLAATVLGIIAAIESNRIHVQNKVAQAIMPQRAYSDDLDFHSDVRFKMLESPRFSWLSNYLGKYWNRDISSLVVYGDKAESDIVRYVLRLKRLRNLHFVGYEPSASDLRHISKMQQLQWLHVATKKKYEREFIENMRKEMPHTCLLYTSPSPRDQRGSRMPSSA